MLTSSGYSWQWCSIESIVLLINCCVTSYPQAQWLKTMNISCLAISGGQKNHKMVLCLEISPKVEPTGQGAGSSGGLPRGWFTAKVTPVVFGHLISEIAVDRWLQRLVNRSFPSVAWMSSWQGSWFPPEWMIQEGRKITQLGRKSQSFHSQILKIVPLNIWCILIIRNESLCPNHTLRERHQALPFEVKSIR